MAWQEQTQYWVHVSWNLWALHWKTEHVNEAATLGQQEEASSLRRLTPNLAVSNEVNEAKLYVAQRKKGWLSQAKSIVRSARRHTCNLHVRNQQTPYSSVWSTCMSIFQYFLGISVLSLSLLTIVKDQNPGNRGPFELRIEGTECLFDSLILRYTKT